MIEQEKEVKKLNWMKANFIEECKKMLVFIEKQRTKVKEERHKTAQESQGYKKAKSGLNKLKKFKP